MVIAFTDFDSAVKNFYNSTMFYFENIDSRKILKSDMLEAAEAFFTTREICIKSKDPSMRAIVDENKKIITNYLKILPENLISPTQTHSVNIKTANVSKHDYPETDALILAEKNIGIFLNFADCTPIILYDPKQNTGGIAHAGWRGTAQKIAPLTVEKMRKEFGSKPMDIIALIGPAIGFCCYDVKEDVRGKLSKSVTDFYGLSEVREGGIFVDLKGINRRQLEECGVRQIDVCPYCTVHNNNTFFSYRCENATGNRHSAVLRLR